MAVNGSDKSKFSLGGGGGDDEDGSLTFKRHTSREKNMRNTVSSDDDDVPHSQRLSQMMNFGTCSNRNVPIKKRRTTGTRPAKRTFDDINSLQDFVKKSKDTEKDHNPLSREVEMEGKSAETPFSLLKNELSLVEKSFEECKKKRQEEEERLQSIKRDIEECDKDLETKEAELSLMDDLMVERNQELRTKNIEIYKIDKVREEKEWKLNAIEKQIDRQAEILQSERRRFHDQMKELQSEKKDVDSRMKQLKLRERQLEEREKELELKEEEVKSQVKELESKKKQFEGQEKLLDDQVKAFVSKKEKFKSQVEVVQELKRVLSQMDDFESEEKQPDALIEPFDEEAELGNQSSPTSEQNDELESVDDDILVNLQAASDPSKVVLDIILNLTIKKSKIGDDAVIIDESHIFLLKELRKISPDIRPHVREEAMKLALAVKANMQENTENSVVILGFLLLLSIYGLVPSFDEDDVLKLFGLVSQHNIAVELFGAMGFADKISDFAENLIKRQQYDEAVRFSRAYNFSDNDQLVGLFEEHVQNLKLISESSCKETNSIEIKDKARDQEVASLKAVIQSIEDNNLEFKDLLNKIDDRVLELRRQNGK